MDNEKTIIDLSQFPEFEGRMAQEELIDIRYGIPALQERYINKIPSLKMAISYARNLLGYSGEVAVIEDWYRNALMAFWCDEGGNPIHNWGWHLARWISNFDYFKHMRDPERLPDVRKTQMRGGFTPRKADNWIGTKPEDLEKVF